MERNAAVIEKDLGWRSGPLSPNKLKRPSICYGDFYGDGARFWQPFSCKDSSSMGTRKFPFTSSQWQELQRQALIYKHIMASVPVPLDLLHPSAAKSFPEAPSIYLPPATIEGRVVGDGAISVRFPNSTDPELGRCRRTDGKKWRCARDAAPDQKYCERHLHRGRPRSRKPVEQRTTSSKLTTAVASPATAAVQATSPAAASGHGFVPNLELNFPFHSMKSNGEPRCQDWMNSYSENLALNKHWEMMHCGKGLKHSANPEMQHYEGLQNLNADTNDIWCPFLNPKLSSLDNNSVADHSEAPRRFIDAWSRENIAPTTTTDSDKSAVFSRDKLPLSTLTLSMSNTITIEEGTDNIDMKSQPFNWMAADAPLGGTLAEVLRSSNMASPHNSGSADSNKNNTTLMNLMCKSWCGSHEASPRDSPSSMVSSPSGVLQKALVSLSDSSSSSSPTFAATALRSDFALQWMNLNK